MASKDLQNSTPSLTAWESWDINIPLTQRHSAIDQVEQLDSPMTTAMCAGRIVLWAEDVGKTHMLGCQNKEVISTFRSWLLVYMCSRLRPLLTDLSIHGHKVKSGSRNKRVRKWWCEEWDYKTGFPTVCMWIVTMANNLRKQRDLFSSLINGLI